MSRESAISLTVPMIAVAALIGCAGVGQGAASYDTLAAAAKDCKDRGGELQLRQGYDERELSSYDCVGARR